MSTKRCASNEKLVALRQVLTSIEHQDAWDYFKRRGWAGERLYALLADLESAENEPIATRVPGDSAMNIISYKVTVTAVIERVEKTGKDWTVIGQNADGSDQRGYTPEIEKTVTRETAIYEQRVETLDMGQLVSVVNKLQPG